MKGSNNGWLETLEMNDINYVKNNYTDLRNISYSLNVRPFNPELPGSWRPQGKLEEKVMNWEENLVLSLNRMAKDDRKTLICYLSMTFMV